MKGVVSKDFGTLVLASHLAERERPDVRTCTHEGGGIHETRPEYLTVHETYTAIQHPDPLRREWALVAVVDDKKVRLDKVRTNMAAKRQRGEASPAESEVADLPAEITLDASWGAGP